MSQPTRLTCPVCGEEFQALKFNQKFCSPKCRVASAHAYRATQRLAARSATGSCPGCGAEFRRVGRQLYCSRKCAARMGTRKRLGIEDPGLIRNCWWCNKEFHLLNALRLYCSKECSWFVKSLWNVSRYGITRDDYREAWYRQGGLCAVCKQPERTARNHLLSIDHDHESGRFRGLLCSHCNRAIGLLQDDPEIIRSAAEYVTAGQQLKLIPQEVSHG